ncbi:hypothetical protein QIH93_10100 [Bradyrhizobium ottawaense]|uniref:hypothetical protein n=1 Tax=Bradyrhizobium ottawaense TaxID=931866 RepID=UPI00271559B9|nr:hypothetical protein [Bradyrhizobium ottawaense]WLB48306.1 hypothetical protein QIH93_10100 [Bradyrhizobium ottawaense]
MMPRILFVTQEKGGVGKTVFARALAEAIVGAPVIEIDASPRMIELGDRVTFFKMRADREAIEKTGGKASRAEFDGVLAALEAATAPTIVDVGANTSLTFLRVVADIAPVLSGDGFEFGVCVVVTTEHGAIAATPTILSLTKPWAKAQFLIENRLHEAIDPETLKKIGHGARITSFDHQSLEKGADEYLQAGGLSSITRLDEAELRKVHGIGPALRIQKDLQRFRKEAMEAARPAAEWLIG